MSLGKTVAVAVMLAIALYGAMVLAGVPEAGRSLVCRTLGLFGIAVFALPVIFNKKGA